jgi:hypothetical protein
MAESFSIAEARNKPEDDRGMTIAEARITTDASAMEALTRGVIQSPGAVTEQLKAARDIMNSGIDFSTMDRGESMEDRTEAVADRFAPEPTGAIGQGLETVGKQAIPALVGGMAAGIPGGMGAGLGEATLALTSPLVNEGAQSMGASPGQAAGAEAAYNLIAPGAALRTIRGLGYRGAMQPGIHEVMANRQARGLVPPDASGQNRWAEAAVEDLVQSQTGLENPLDSRTADMILAESAPGFESTAISKAGNDQRFQVELGGRKLHLGDLQERRIVEALGASDEPLSSVRESWSVQRDSSYKANETLWKQLDFDGEPPATDVSLQRAMDVSWEEAGKANADTLPTKQFDQIDEFNGNIPWSEMQRFRSRFGAIAQEASGPSPTAKQRLRARHARRMVEAIDETIENASAGLSQRYPEAIASHRRYRTVFDGNTKAYKAFDTQENPRLLVREIMDGRNAIAEARNVRSMFADDIAGLDDFKTTVARDTFQPEVGATSAKAIRNKYKQRRQAMLELWTADDIRAFDKLADAGVETTVSKAGRRAMAYGTQSGTRQMAGKNVMEWIWSKMGDVGFGNDILKNRAFERFYTNPGELIPVLKAYKSGNAKDALKFILGHLTKTAARAAAYTSGPRVISGNIPQEELRQ